VGADRCPAEDSHVAVVVVEACDLELPAGADLSFRRNFFVQTALQNGTALPPEQRGKCIQFIERRRECAARLCVIGFEWTGPLGMEAKTTVVLQSSVRRTFNSARGRSEEAAPQVPQGYIRRRTAERAISKRHRATLIKTNAAEGRPDGSQLGFTKD